MGRVKRILERGIIISGALVRIFIGVGSTVLLLCSLKKKKAK